MDWVREMNVRAIASWGAGAHIARTHIYTIALILFNRLNICGYVEFEEIGLLCSIVTQVQLFNIQKKLVLTSVLIYTTLHTHA